MTSIASSRTWLAVLAAALLVPGALAGVPRTETKSYVGGTGDVVIVCPAELPHTGVGGVCFRLDGSETRASLLIRDSTGRPASGYVIQRGPNGENLGSTPVCDTTWFYIPSGTVSLSVFIREATAPYFNCNFLPSPSGTVTASFA